MSFLVSISLLFCAAIVNSSDVASSFKCPGGKPGVHPALPHPDSCRLYYICHDGVTPNEAGCASGLVFNKETAQCDEPKNVPGCEMDLLLEDHDTLVKKSAKPTTDSDETDPEDLAKLLTLLSNPKLKSFLKPEVVDALGSVEAKTEAGNEKVEVTSTKPASISETFRRQKRPPFLRQTKLKTEEVKSASDSAISTPNPLNRSKFTPRVRPLLNRFRTNKPSDEQTTSTTTTTTTTTTTQLPSIIEVFHDKTDESEDEEKLAITTTLPSIVEVFPEKSTELILEAVTTTASTSTEAPSEQPSTSSRTRLRYPRPNAFRGPSGQGFRRTKLSEQKNKENDEDDKKVSELKEEKIKSLLAESSNPNGLGPSTKEELPTDL